MSFDPVALPWLAGPPSDFRRRCQRLQEAEHCSDIELRNLSTYALDLNQLTKLAKTITALLPRLQRTSALSDFRLALLSNATTEFLGAALVASAPRHGVLVELVQTAFDNAAQEVFSANTLLESSRPDAVLLALNHRAFGLDHSILSREEADRRLTQALEYIRGLIKAITDGLGTLTIVQTVAPPPEPWLGHSDRIIIGSAWRTVFEFNRRLTDIAAETGSIVLDIERLASLVGQSRWHDHAQWHSAKIPFSLDVTSLYADHVVRLLAAIRGKTRKCLVLDLDNTIWGGVIGDDGLEGIRLGQGSAEGEAFLAVQHYALECRKRGIVLAVCSKNEEETARLPFRQHPDMLLKEEHISVFTVNWQDKDKNIKHVAKLLNIGTDALVFLDDNPAERERIRQMLPEVAVPELPDDPALYPAAVAHAGYFETVSISAEDGKRADLYRANVVRSTAMEHMGSLEQYLASLDMVCTMTPFDRVGRARITQLINKTNQFNLTTRRYTEFQVAAMETDANLFTLQIRLKDKFGDNGIISVVIFEKHLDVWQCDIWLMSCRVFGRRIEEATMAEVAAAAAREGARRLIGRYIPTAKNRMVAEHFRMLGFEKVSESTDGQTWWALDLQTYQSPRLPMEIIVAPAACTEREMEDH